MTESGEFEEDLSPPVTPVFQTQVPYDGTDESQNRAGKKTFRQGNFR